MRFYWTCSTFRGKHMMMIQALVAISQCSFCRAHYVKRICFTRYFRMIDRHKAHLTVLEYKLVIMRSLGTIKMSTAMQSSCKDNTGAFNSVCDRT